MRRLFLWLWKHTTAEVLAVAAFLAVAGGLWSWMQPVPSVTLSYQFDDYSVIREFSPDGSLYLIYESQWGREASSSPKESLPPWQNRLRVFDMQTGQQAWEWNSGKSYIDQVTWTAKNQVFFCLYADDGTSCQILGFDPHHGQVPVFHKLCDSGRRDKSLLVRASFYVSGDGNYLCLKHFKEISYSRPPADPKIGRIPPEEPYRLELVDIRTGESRRLPQAVRCVYHTVHFSPDNSLLLTTEWHTDGTWIHVYDVKSARLHRRFFANSHHVYPQLVAFSPDSRLLAVCESHLKCGYCADIVRVWDVDNDQLVAVLDDFPFHGKEPFPFTTEVKSVAFLPSGQLCVATGAANYEYEEKDTPWFPQTDYPYPFWPSLHFFDTTTFRRLLCLENARHLQHSRDGRYIAAWTRRGEMSGEVVVNLETLHERADLPGGEQPFVASGFGELRDGRDLYFIGKVKPVVVPAWHQTVRRWLGLKNEQESLLELTFQDCRDGKEIDRWSFNAVDLEAMTTPPGNGLSLRFKLGQGQERLELYPLPPRRPWLHIFGWALIVGIGVELLGLGWRRLRRKKLLPVT